MDSLRGKGFPLCLSVEINANNTSQTVMNKHLKKGNEKKHV